MEELPLIVALCSLESKLRMVEAFRRHSKVVAMTSDNVNDSIKEADVGIAMGRRDRGCGGHYAGGGATLPPP